MKVLFIHNALPEYRIIFFRKLSELVSLEILVTDKELASKIYGLSFQKDNGLNVSFLEQLSDISDKIKSKQYDLVVLPPVDTPFQWVCAWKAYVACKMVNIKFVYWTEKWEPSFKLQPLLKRTKNYVQALMIGFFARKANVCIGAGKQSVNYLRSIGVAKRLIATATDSSTSPKVNDTFDIRKIYGLKVNARVILFLGRIVERKGCDDLIYAFRLIKRKYKDSVLLVCGEGPHLARCKKLAASVDASSIIFAGKVEPVKRAEYFKQSDVFVLPSYTLNGVIEAWGLTVNESLEQGTPVVTTTAVGAAYDLADNKCCFMADENSPESLAENIMKVFDIGDLTNLCQQQYQMYSVEKMAAGFFNAFKEAIK